ncbi:hypothetical protein M9H77_06193 [Catharanthus roseus]|uniref:Uncharacterized protein n=1 Tax=Catharanthus roseus TaxID=4058 RepID=A0ACC0BRK9_CATRO|nr:hypothetical protein M9H77_06193 [Catharanthus roseus]
MAGKDMWAEDGGTLKRHGDKGMSDTWLMLRYHARKTSNSKRIKVWYLTTWFQQSMNIIRENEKEFACFLSESAHGVVLGECEKIYVPVMWTKSHWFLFIVDLIKQKIMLLDSMQTTKESYRKRKNL